MTLSEFGTTWHGWLRATVELNSGLVKCLDEVVSEILDEVVDDFGCCLSSWARTPMSAQLIEIAHAWVVAASEACNTERWEPQSKLQTTVETTDLDDKAPT